MGIYLIYVIEKTGMLDLNKSQPACSRRSKFNTKIQYIIQKILNDQQQKKEKTT